MAIVINPNEVMLNSIKYRIIDRVQPVLASTMPAKQVTGDYSLESDPNISTWVINDQRGGILLEEMRESNQADSTRSYWSTSDCRFRGQITLPPLVTTVTNPTVTNPTLPLTTGTVQGASATNYDDHQVIANFVAGQHYTFTCQLRAVTNPDNTAVCHTHIILDDGVSTSESAAVNGDAGYAATTVGLHVAQTAAKLWVTIRLTITNAGNGNGAVADYTTGVLTTPAVGTPGAFCNFNNSLYLAYGQILAKLNAGGTAFVFLKSFAASITSLDSSLNSCMYVYLGDSENYWYISTAEVFTVTSVALAKLSVQWDDKEWKLATDNTISYTVTPNSATPNWTANGKIDLPADYVNTVLLYRDANGNYIIYGATKSGLWAHDFANGKWVETELSLPDHPTCGMGAVHWKSGLYISQGAGVYLYIAGSSASIDSVGLDRDGGLPQYRGGEIVKAIKGFNEWFALLDSTYEGTTSRSSIMAYDGVGWQCRWLAGSDNVAMRSGIVSSVFAYRLWFAAGTTVYYIPLQRSLMNPKKVAGYTYAAASVHITPWFDADWANGIKIGTAFRVKTSGCSADETVVVKYRINHTNTDLTTGWTTLGTISSNTTTTYTFASGAGLEFKSIQFEFDLARGATTTLSPNIEWAALSYIKTASSTANTPVSWGYRFTVDCTESYDGQTPSQMINLLKTAIEATTLIPFGFRNDTGGTESYYGRITEVNGDVQTGTRKEGQYSLYLVVP